MANRGDDFAKALERLTALDRRLSADTWRCHAAIVALQESQAGGAPFDLNETEFWLRTSLRVFFAQVEGLSFAMRDATVFLARQGHVDLSEGELTVLDEKRYRLRYGKVESIDAFNTTFDNLLLAFHYFPRAFGAGFALAKDDARWVAFKNSLALRNKLTHPKSPGDLDLSEASILEFAQAFKWFAEQVTGCFGAILEHFERELPL